MSNSRRRAALLGALACLMSFVLCLPATAAPASGSQGTGGESLPDQRDGRVPTSATVDSTGSPAQIECAWALPDIDHNVTNTFTYGDDDDPALQPTPPFPCDLSDAGRPEQGDGAKNMIQVLPTRARGVQVWAAVDHPAGVAEIDDVHWKVFRPDGSPRVQVQGVAVPVSACAQQTAMFDAANDTGQVSSAAIDDPNDGLVALCQEQVKRLYFASFTIPRQQRCGEWRIETHTVSNGVESPVLNYYIDVLCYFDLHVDFAAVDWGQMVPGSTKIVAGDTTFKTGDGRPTVENRGNTGIGVGIEYAPLVQQGTQLPKVITAFDACFGRSAATIQCQDPITGDPSSSSDRFDFDANRQRTLCANDRGKLDLSVHPPAGLPNGSYAGSMTIYGFHQPHANCPAFELNVQQPVP